MHQLLLKQHPTFKPGRCPSEKVLFVSGNVHNPRNSNHDKHLSSSYNGPGTVLSALYIFSFHLHNASMRRVLLLIHVYR